LRADQFHGVVVVTDRREMPSLMATALAVGFDRLR
jgi:hypothetical protein